MMAVCNVVVIPILDKDMTVSASIPCAEVLIKFVIEVTGDHLCTNVQP